MKEGEEKEDDEDCCCSCDFCIERPILFLNIFIIVLDSISIIMNILVLSVTNWKFAKQESLALTIISFIFVCVVLGFDITILVLKKNLYKNNKKYILSKIFSLIILIINPLLFVINIFLAIYISIKIHIADYPEYGGRKRNKEYIKSHPDEFGSVSSGEFVIAALCPTLAAIAQFICMFFSIALFRRIYYLPENYEDGKKQNDVVTITNENERKDIQIVGYRRNLKMTKTDDRLYPNKKNLPEDLKYSSERVFEEINNEGKEEEKNNKENI